MSSKTALVISGGGAKGAFAIGALEYILGVRQPSFDIVVGTSTGALISPFIVAERGGTLDYPAFHVVKHAYLTKTTEEFVKPRGVLAVARGAVSVFDTAPLEAVIADLMGSDVYRAVVGAAALGVQMFIVTVCLQTGEVVYWQTGPAGTAPRGTRLEPIGSHDRMKQAILASANQPVLMPPVDLKGSDNRTQQYVDGGVREYAGLRAALENGADEIYAIYLSPRPDARTPKTQRYAHAIPTQETMADRKKQSIVERTLDLFLLDIFENDIRAMEQVNEVVRYVDALRDRLSQLDVRIGGQAATPQQLDAVLARPKPDVPNPVDGKRYITVHEIFPETTLEVGSLEVDPARMFEMYDEGYEAAEKLFR